MSASAKTTRVTEKSTKAESGKTEVSERLYVDLISEAMRDEMRGDPSVYFMGQDVAEFGGPFNISTGFLDEFGPQRVFNTPIAESGTIGMAVGSAMLGQRPIVEMQFGDFVSCCFNQIANVAAKMFYRTEIPVPMVIRLPSGGGMGAGAFHSQNTEAWFAHIPGLKLVAPAFAEDAYLLLRAAIRDPNPVLFFEHKYLYRRQRAVKPELPEDYAECSRSLVAEAKIRRAGKNITIVSYGWMVHKSLEAAELLAAEGIEAEVIDLRILAPMDLNTVLQSIAKTQKVIVVHEATQTCGIGAEIVAQIADKAIADLNGPIKRVCYPDQPSPFSKILENEALPQVDEIAAAAREVIAW